MQLPPHLDETSQASFVSAVDLEHSRSTNATEAQSPADARFHTALPPPLMEKSVRCSSVPAVMTCGVKRARLDADGDSAVKTKTSSPYVRRVGGIALPDSPETSCLSPKREPVSLLCYSGTRSKPMLRRSHSMSEVASRKSLHFDEGEPWSSSQPEEGLYTGSGARPTSTSFSSLPQLPIGRAAAEQNLKSWQSQTAKRPYSSSGSDDGYVSKAYCSPVIFNHMMNTSGSGSGSSSSGPAEIPGSLTECTKKLGDLDVSHDSLLSSSSSTSIFNRQALEESIISSNSSSPRCSDLSMNFDADASFAARPSFEHPGTILHAAPVLPVFQHSYFETPTREQLIIQECHQINVEEVVLLCKAKLKLVIFDMDNTLLQIHTKSKWYRSPEELSKHVRPVFKKLLLALVREHIPVGIATFSDQEELIEKMLVHAFGDEVQIEGNVFVRGTRRGEPMLSTQPDDDHAAAVFGHDNDDDEDRMGKRKHIQCIVSRVPGIAKVAPEEILFVDDDRENVAHALNDGHRAVNYRYNAHAADSLFLSECCTALKQD